MTDRTKPLYMIGVVAEMLKVHPQTLRFYEKKGLVRPSRTEGQTRMYSEEDVEEMARVLRLTRDHTVTPVWDEGRNGLRAPDGGLAQARALRAASYRCARRRCVRPA